MNEPLGVGLDVGGEGKAPSSASRGEVEEQQQHSGEQGSRVLGDSSHWAFYGDDKEPLLPWEAQRWQERRQA